MHAMSLRVAIVEDHPVLRDVLREYVERLPQVAHCTVAPSAEAALADLETSVPDLMLIDLSLPGMDGIALISELHRRLPELPCAILSGHDSRSYVGQAFAAGALGYLLKGDPVEIERGIAAMLAGERYLSDGLKSPA
jgi:DNA-binding NarL/FixJ family response regulator